MRAVRSKSYTIRLSVKQETCGADRAHIGTDCADVQFDLDLHCPYKTRDECNPWQANHHSVYHRFCFQNRASLSVSRSGIRYADVSLASETSLSYDKLWLAHVVRKWSLGQMISCRLIRSYMVRRLSTQTMCYIVADSEAPDQTVQMRVCSNMAKSKCIISG